MREPLVDQPERFALLSVIVDEAYREAVQGGLFAGISDQEAKCILFRRMVSAVEAGETDLTRLRSLAFQNERLGSCLPAKTFAKLDRG